jgi:hypothetical protein
MSAANEWAQFVGWVGTHPTEAAAIIVVLAIMWVCK